MPGDQPAPLGQVVAGVADDQRLAFGAEGGVQADDFAQREGEHAVGEALDHVLLGGEGQARQVGQRFEAEVAQLLAVAADVAAEAGQQGLEALELDLLQLGAETVRRRSQVFAEMLRAVEECFPHGSPGR